MSDESAGDAIARLEVALAADPGAPGFAALSEAYRRAGRLADAERVARDGLEHKPGCLEGVIALGLALLDQNRIVEARGALEGAAAEAHDAAGLVAATPPDFDSDLSDRELESAFDQAETDRDEVIDADRIAHEAMLGTDGEDAVELSELTDSSFATNTVADLLESQGNPEAASRIRSAIARSSEPERERMVTTLENWIENLRRKTR